MKAEDSGYSASVRPLARLAAKELRGRVTELGTPRELKVRAVGRTFIAVLTPDLAAGGYSIQVPELPGVVTEADTIEEAQRMVGDAIRLWMSVASEAPRRGVK